MSEVNKQLVWLATDLGVSPAQLLQVINESEHRDHEDPELYPHCVLCQELIKMAVDDHLASDVPTEDVE